MAFPTQTLRGRADRLRLVPANRSVRPRSLLLSLAIPVGNGAPDVNVAVPRATLTTGGVSGGNAPNASGNTPFENATGVNPLVPGASGNNVGTNANVSPGGASAVQGPAANSMGTANVSGVIPAARAPAAGGPAPNAITPTGNVATGGTPGIPPATGSAAGSTTSNNPPAARSGAGGPSPPALGQSAPAAPPAGRGVSAAENQTFSPTGLSKPAEDGISTKIIPAKPCTSAARETDGTTTCVGIPSSPPR